MRVQTATHPEGVAWARVAALAVSLALLALTTSPLRGQSTLEWHGYGQFRYTRGSNTTGFHLRRAKLWAKGPVPGVDQLSFKIQGIYRNGAAGAFVLQDFFAEYHASLGRLRLGQMVPDFSLQRAQPDFLVPLVERAGVVDALIPGAMTLARDLGAQISLGAGTSPFYLSAGVFNGAGANHAGGREGDFLATTRVTYSMEPAAGLKATVGVSGAYRETAGTDVGIISTAGKAFAGKDARWGMEAHLQGEGWELQGEYLEGHLEKESTRGFYILGGYLLTPEDQLVLSVEHLNTPRSDRDEDPWYIGGFNHLFFDPSDARSAGHPPIPNGSDGRIPTKLMVDLRVQPTSTGTEYGASVQLQFFLH